MSIVIHRMPSRENTLYVTRSLGSPDAVLCSYDYLTTPASPFFLLLRIYVQIGGSAISTLSSQPSQVAFLKQIHLSTQCTKPKLGIYECSMIRMAPFQYLLCQCVELRVVTKARIQAQLVKRIYSWVS